MSREVSTSLNLLMIRQQTLERTIFINVAPRRFRRTLHQAARARTRLRLVCAGREPLG